MKRLYVVFAALACAVNAGAQNAGEVIGNLIGVVGNMVVENAQEAAAAQQNLAFWGVKPGNFSGITPLGDGRYAVVSDKESADGFYIWKIEQDPETGRVKNLVNEGFFANTVDADASRDCEGIAYNPRTGTLFISGEADQRIIEYDMDGQRTGRELEIPDQFRNAAANQGFEALTFGGRGFRKRYWTTTESTLPSDGPAAGPSAPGVENLLRIQSFKRNLVPSGQFAYRMDAGRSYDFGTTYVFGVPELCAMPDGSLLVLEREANIPKIYVGASVVCKLYRVRPGRSKMISPDAVLSELEPGQFLEKETVRTWSTRLSLTDFSWANYEGMCLGAKLSDGRQTLLLVSDSQGGYGKGAIRLQDYIKVIVLD